MYQTKFNKMDTNANTTLRIKQLMSEENSDESYFRKRMLENLSSSEERALMLELANKGWNRRKFFDISLYINFNEKLKEEEYDIFGGFIDTLTGHCNGACILHLPNDPENSDEFVKYVLSNAWKNETW